MDGWEGQEVSHPLPRIESRAMSSRIEKRLHNRQRQHNRNNGVERWVGIVPGIGSGYAGNAGTWRAICAVCDDRRGKGCEA